MHPISPGSIKLPSMGSWDLTSLKSPALYAPPDMNSKFLYFHIFKSFREYFFIRLFNILFLFLKVLYLGSILWKKAHYHRCQKLSTILERAGLDPTPPAPPIHRACPLHLTPQERGIRARGMEITGKI